MPKVFLNKRTLSTKTAFATLIAEFVLKTPHISRSRRFFSAVEYRDDIFFGRRGSEEPAFRISVTLIRTHARTLRGAPRGRKRVAYNKHIF